MSFLETVDTTCRNLNAGNVWYLDGSGNLVDLQSQSGNMGFCMREKDDAHTLKVASRIAHNQDEGLRHAAEATLYIKNEDALKPASAYDELLALLRDAGVKLVNESLDMNAEEQSYDVWAHLRDWYARNRGMKFFKSAGQSELDAEDPHTGAKCRELDSNGDPACVINGVENHRDCYGEVVCQGLNTMCVTSTSDQRTNDDFLDDCKFCDDTIGGPFFRNPGEETQVAGDDGTDETKIVPYEIEKPDVATHGRCSYVANSLWRQGGEANWKEASGTSFASPAIAGLAVLFEEKCGARSPMLTRAIFRTASWVRQELENKDSDPIYPSPNFHPKPDSLVGAGILEATRLHKFCGGGSSGDPSTASGSFDGTGWNDPDDTPSYFESASMSVTDPEVITHEEWSTVPGALAPGTELVYKKLHSLGSMPEGGGAPV